MNQYVQQSIFQKYVNILYEKLKQAIKASLEYKTNLYSVLMFDIIAFFVYTMFFKVYKTAIGEILIWTNYDFIVYFLLLLAGGKGMWLLSLMKFNTFLLEGGINTYLTKPVNTFFLSLIRNTSGVNIITFPMFFILMCILIVLGNYQNYFISFCILLFAIFYYQMFVNLVQSLAFFMKKNEFFFESARRLIFVNEQFTPKMFENSGFKTFFYLLPTSIFGYFTLESLKGNITQLQYYFPFMVITLICFIVGTYALWYYGLKKYEAFG